MTLWEEYVAKYPPRQLPYEKLPPFDPPWEEVEIRYDLFKLRAKFNLTHPQALLLYTMVGWHRHHLIDSMIHVRSWRGIAQPTIEDAQEWTVSQQAVPFRLDQTVHPMEKRIHNNLAKKGFIEIRHIDYHKDAPFLLPYAKAKQIKRGFDVWIPKWEGFDRKIEELLYSPEPAPV